MHGHEPRLGAVAHHEEDERQLHDPWREPRRDPEERRPPERVDLVAEELDVGEVDEDRPEERDRDADRADQEVLVRGLEGGARTLEVHEEDRGEGRALDRDPHEPDVVGGHRKEHREHEQVEERVEAPRGVARRLRRSEPVHQTDEHDHPRRQRVGAQEAVERGQDAVHVDRQGDRQRRREGERRGDRVHGRRQAAAPPRQQERARQGNREHDEEHHPRSSRSRASSVEACSRRTCATTPSMISTTTRTSRKTPASTMDGRP